MTVGLIITDNRRFDDDGFSTQQTLYGEYYNKSWHGADRSDPTDMSPHNYNMDVTHQNTGYIILPNGRKASPLSGFGGWPMPSLQFSENDSLKLYVKLGNKIRAHDFNASIFLAEADQSLALIGETATRLAKFLDNLKKGNLYKASKFLAGGDSVTRRAQMARAMQKHFKNRSAFDDRAALANAVLEVQYGWRPLLSDANGFGVAAGTLLSKPVRKTCMATRRLSDIKTTPVLDTSFGVYTYVTRRVISEQLKATISAPPSWQSQLRLNNPFQAISNRTPWEFVLNWFLPIEDYLEARSVFTDLNISQLIRTRKTYSSGLIRGNLEQETWFKSYSFVREVMPVSDGSSSAATLPLPRLKSFEKSLGWEHVMNGIALLNGTVKRYRD